MEIKEFKIPMSKVTRIGDCEYFNDDEEFSYYKHGDNSLCGTYRNMQVLNRPGMIYKNKAEAIEAAERYHKNSKSFANGEIPFDIIFFHRGLGWCHLTSNSLNNDSWIRKQEKEKSTS